MLAASSRCQAWCCVLVLLTISGSVTSDVSHVEGQRLLKNVLQGLDKIADFFKEDYSAINMDGLFGIRMAQGTLIQSLTYCTTSQCPEWLVDRLNSLNYTIGTTAERATSYVQSQDEDYYSMFHKTIDSPYLIEAGGISLDKEDLTPGLSKDYKENVGDRCFAGLMGTLADGSPPCTITDSCMTMMTLPNQSAYSLTHQLLFYIIAEKERCLDAVDGKLSSLGLSDVRSFRQSLCGHIFAEVKLEVVNGSVHTSTQDLFLEQSMLCGVIGFQEFFTPQWMSLVLSWQTHRGCFTSHSPLLGWFAKEQRAQEDGGKLLKLLRQEAQEIDSQPSVGHRKLLKEGDALPSVEERGLLPDSPPDIGQSILVQDALPRMGERRLLRERVMDGDCLSHKSGLGAGLLGVYQRYLVMSGPW